MKQPILLFGYDTEYYGRKANSEKEAKECCDHEVASVRKLVALHKAKGVPATFFMLGRLVELEPRFKQIFRSRSGLIDLQQHTYSHSLVMEKPGFDRPMITAAQLKSEILKTSLLIKDAYGVVCTGVRLPYTYKGGLQGHAPLQKAIKDAGMSFVSSDNSSGDQKSPSFISNPVQPYRYKNGLIELPLNGFMDTSLLRPPWKSRKSLDLPSMFLEEFRFAVENSLVYAPGFHPWALAMVDPKLDIIKNLIKEARRLGVEMMSYHGLCSRVGEYA
jgi:peptidoglycan/xylan/chitin deacetylase (PgdA/CDA1 family)